MASNLARSHNSYTLDKTPSVLQHSERPVHRVERNRGDPAAHPVVDGLTSGCSSVFATSLKTSILWWVILIPAVLQASVKATTDGQFLHAHGHQVLIPTYKSILNNRITSWKLCQSLLVQILPSDYQLETGFMLSGFTEFSQLFLALCVRADLSNVCGNDSRQLPSPVP